MATQAVFIQEAFISITLTIELLLVSSGLPKAAVVTQERIWAASFIQGISGVTSDDVFYVNLPLYHSAGFVIGIIGCIERGKGFQFCTLSIINHYC